MSDRVAEPTAPSVDQGTRAAEAQPETVEVIQTADDVVEDLRRQMAELEKRDAEKDRALEAERERVAAAERARQAAETRAREADNKAAQASTEGRRSIEHAQLDAVSNSLVAQQGQMASLRTQQEAALASGEFAKVAEINATMAEIGGQIAQLQAGKAELEARVKAPIEDRSTQQQQPSLDEQREAWIRARPVRVQDWLRSDKGSRFFTDEQFQRRALAAAQYAEQNKGISPHSQEYVDFIEEELGLRQPSQRQNADDGGRQPATNGAGRNADDRQASRMTTAPAGGAVSGSVRTNAGVTEVYLTREEKEQALRMGVSESDWAREKKKLLDEGLIGPGARNR